MYGQRFGIARKKWVPAPIWRGSSGTGVGADALADVEGVGEEENFPSRAPPRRSVAAEAAPSGDRRGGPTPS